MGRATGADALPDADGRRGASVGERREQDGSSRLTYEMVSLWQATGSAVRGCDAERQTSGSKLWAGRPLTSDAPRPVS